MIHNFRFSCNCATDRFNRWKQYGKFFDHLFYFLTLSLKYQLFKMTCHLAFWTLQMKNHQWEKQNKWKYSIDGVACNEWHFNYLQTYVTDIFLAQSWRDPRLRLPENMSEEYRILDVEWLHNIWRPDCFFKNAKKVTFHEMSIPNHYLWLYHDKTLLYMSKYVLNITLGSVCSITAIVGQCLGISRD